MILHCKNAEMAIYNFSFFHYFFLIWQFFTSEEIKKSQIFFFFLKCKNLGRRIRKPRNKKKSPNIQVYITGIQNVNI